MANGTRGTPDTLIYKTGNPVWTMVKKIIMPTPEDMPTKA